MFFSKKKKNEPVIEVPAEQVVELKPRDAIEEWGDHGKEIVTGYILKAQRMWNFNNPNKLIPDESMDQLFVGLKMAFTSTPPQKAIALCEEVNKQEKTETFEDNTTLNDNTKPAAATSKVKDISKKSKKH